MIVNIKDKDIGINKIPSLIRKLSFIFNFENKNISNYDFQITANKLDAISALVIFKVFEFNIKHSCLNKPTANLNHILNLFSVYGVEKMMKKLINQEEVDELYKNLKPSSNDEFFIAPHAINRTNFKDREDLENKYTEYIADYYEKICPKLVPYFKSCICEIASNFLYHALEDKNSILMAQGDRNKIEIVCVDNSKGIISTLNSNSNNHNNIMRSAFKRGVSSKINDSHCGTGLWFVEKIAQHLNGTLRVYSEDMSYICKGDKVFVRKSPYWKGSIFYLKLNVTDNTNIDNFFAQFSKENDLGIVSQ